MTPQKSDRERLAEEYCKDVFCEFDRDNDDHLFSHGGFLAGYDARDAEVENLRRQLREAKTALKDGNCDVRLRALEEIQKLNFEEETDLEHLYRQYRTITKQCEKLLTELQDERQRGARLCNAMRKFDQGKKTAESLPRGFAYDAVNEYQRGAYGSKVELEKGNRPAGGEE